MNYGAVRAVAGAELHVEEGEIVALLGANGAGKTSLLNAIAGLVPASGEVTFEGTATLGLPPERIVRRGIALSPEGRRVFPTLTVAENLRLGAASRSDRHEIAETRERVLARFPILRERSGQLAGTLSGGQQQMLAVGRALMSRPRLLLLDEPSLGLAPIIVDELFDLIAELRAEGTTILIVEQNALRTLQLADRAYVLASGEIVAGGSAEEIGRSDEIHRAYLGAPV